MVAFHFPPVQGSSGVQRTLRFAQHLPKFGWKPIVLTITPRAYDATAQVVGNELPATLHVERAFGLDAARQLSLFGRYPMRLALPDRWASWKFWALPRARRILATEKVDAVWSTFPVASAHEIGLDIARRTGLPYVAEFRDPMWQGAKYPANPVQNAYWKDLEERVFSFAHRVVTTTRGAASLYGDRFPRFPAARLAVIENGYDEETFTRLPSQVAVGALARLEGHQPLTLLHSGIVYPKERDPSQFFAAIASLKRAGRLTCQELRVRLRATGHDALYRAQLASLDIEDIVTLEPAIDYLKALEEMLAVDGLLLLQASNCNEQVPAKLYEYLRADRPILALTDPQGDTAWTLDQAGAGRIARLDSASEIQAILLDFLDSIRTHSWRRASPEAIRGYSREQQAGQLAALLSDLVR